MNLPHPSGCTFNAYTLPENPMTSPATPSRHHTKPFPSGVISLEELTPNFDCLGYAAFERFVQIREQQLPGYWYLNPITCLNFSTPSPDVQRLISKRQAAWFRVLSRQFKNSWRLMRKRANAREKDFEYDGFVVWGKARLSMSQWDAISRELLDSPACHWEPADSQPN